MREKYLFVAIIVMTFAFVSAFAGIRKVRVTCSACNGTGKDKHGTIDAPNYTGKPAAQVYCDICGRTTRRHTHKTCTLCFGRGWVEKSEYYRDDDSSESVNENISINDTVLLKFEWYYNYEPEPGRRFWYQTDAYSWIEQYPSGYKNYFKYIRDYILDGVNGILVQSVSDSSSVIFIPSRTELNNWLRMKFDNENYWRNIAQIRYIN